MDRLRKFHLTAGIITALTTRQGLATHALTINDLELADPTSSWFVLQSEQSAPEKAAFVGVAAQYLHRPVVIYDSQWNEATKLVARQTCANLTVGMHVADRILFNVNAPFILSTLGESFEMGVDAYRAPSGGGVGDLRFELNVSVLRVAREFEMLVGSRMWLPTGNRYQWTTDGGVRVAPQLSMAGHNGLLKYGMRAAYQHSFVESDFAAEKWDSRLQVAAAVGVQMLDGKFVVGPEVFGSTALGDSFLNQVVTRGEVLLGSHYGFDGWQVGLGWGVGLTSGVGVPDVRALFTVGMNLLSGSTAQ